jgi:hypothetical protein
MTENAYVPETGRFNGISLPTVWNGIPFRSRLEARWAVFFDSMKPRIVYEYEPELIGTPYGAYLPDFWLPELHTFFIVKGNGMDEQEKAKCDWIGKQGYGVFIADRRELPQTFQLWSGPFDPDERFDDKHGGWLYHGSGEYVPGGGAVEEASSRWDQSITFCQCNICGLVGIEFDGRAERLSCGCYSFDERNHGNQYNLDNALRIARRHRFERR